MKTLEVDLGDRAYPIHIGSGLLPLPDLIRPHLEGRNVMVVTNETVGPLYLARHMQALAEHDTATVVLPDGEEHKTLETMGRIITALLTRRFDRQCTLVALGGGWSATSRASPRPVTSVACVTSRCPRPCSPRSIPRSAGRRQSTIRSART